MNADILKSITDLEKATQVQKQALVKEKQDHAKTTESLKNSTKDRYDSHNS
jgi:hypothetical protein